MSIRERSFPDAPRAARSLPYASLLMITVDPPGSLPSVALPISRPALTRFLKRACSLVGLPPSVAVLLTGDAELKRLNRTFRHKNRSTDVLSFPSAPMPGLPAEHAHAGDLAISLETAARQAEQFGHPLSAELRILMLHGLLHLAGYDHEADAGEMAAREAQLRRELRLPRALIDRVTGPLRPATTPRANRPSTGRTSAGRPRATPPPPSRPRSPRRGSLP